MAGYYDPENPYTKYAIESMKMIQADPQNERLYVQRAAAYAAIGQAVELDYLCTILSSLGPLIAEGTSEIVQVRDALSAIQSELSSVTTSLADTAGTLSFAADVVHRWSGQQ